MAATTLRTDQLRDIAALANLDDQEIGGVLDAAEEQTFEAGAEVIRPGTHDTALYFLLEGDVDVLLHAGDPDREVTIARLGPQSVFGEVSFVDPHCHTTSVRTRTPARLLRLDRRDFAALAYQGSRAASKLMANLAWVLARRLQEADASIDDLVQEERSGERAWMRNRFRSRLYGYWSQPEKTDWELS